jgi:hypothetical protein
MILTATGSSKPYSADADENTETVDADLDDNVSDDTAVPCNYKIIVNFGKELITFDEQGKLRVVITEPVVGRKRKGNPAATSLEEVSSAINPMVSLTRLGTLLKACGQHGHVFRQMRGYSKLQLLKGLRVSESVYHGGREGHHFYIHADNAYLTDRRCILRRQETPAFSFVQVRIDDQRLAYAQVVAIIAVTDERIVGSAVTQKNPNEKYSNLFLCITWLSEVEGSTPKTALPFPRYHYELYKEGTRSQLWNNIVHVEDVVLPAFMVPTNPCSWISAKEYSKETIFYALHYERAVIPVTATLTASLQMHINVPTEGEEKGCDGENILLDNDGITRVLGILRQRVQGEEDNTLSSDAESDAITDADLLDSSESEND